MIPWFPSPNWKSSLLRISLFIVLVLFYLKCFSCSFLLYYFLVPCSPWDTEFRIANSLNGGLTIFLYSCKVTPFVLFSISLLVLPSILVWFGAATIWEGSFRESSLSSQIVATNSKLSIIFQAFFPILIWAEAWLPHFSLFAQLGGPSDVPHHHLTFDFLEELMISWKRSEKLETSLSAHWSQWGIKTILASLSGESQLLGFFHPEKWPLSPSVCFLSFKQLLVYKASFPLIP